MGSGSWTSSSFCSYSSTTKGATLDSLGKLTGSGVASNQSIYKQSQIHADLFPKDITRECCDTEEHPNTIPVILALDVTGSMGSAAVEVAKSLNLIMTKLYSEIKDVEFCIMGIGDLYCDHAPIQMSQFESDIRIAEHLDKVYFEFGGGGNAYESYTAAWYMGLYHTKLDCWKRGKKGIIIVAPSHVIVKVEKLDVSNVFIVLLSFFISSNGSSVSCLNEFSSNASELTASFAFSSLMMLFDWISNFASCFPVNTSSIITPSSVST